MELGLQQDGCVVRYVVVHELLHSLGFKHEQNRPDRDEYIDMHWDNIQAGGAGQFFIETWVDTTPTISQICDEDGKPAGETISLTTPPLLHSRDGLLQLSRDLVHGLLRSGLRLHLRHALRPHIVILSGST